MLDAVQVFRVVSVCLGSPPETICWEYRDKEKAFHRMGPLTPQEFYLEHVKPLYDIHDKVSDPTRRLRRAARPFLTPRDASLRSADLPGERPPTPEPLRQAVQRRVPREHGRRAPHAVQQPGHPAA